MKKTLFALLFLLFLLIIACVYQKTYTLYSMQTTQEEAPVVVIDEHQANSIEEKDINTVAKETSKKQTVKKEDIHAVVNPMSKTATEPKKDEVKTSHKEIVDTKTITSPATSTKEVQKETSLYKKVKAKVTEPFTPSTDVKKEEKVVTVKKIVSHTPEASKEELKKVETEAVDYLLTVLKEHDDALGERDATESRLHALIQKVLEERKQAIDAMEEVATSSAKAQATRIEKRDQTSQTIIQNNTKGE